jgi:hypothetical protein
MYLIYIVITVPTTNTMTMTGGAEHTPHLGWWFWCRNFQKPPLSMSAVARVWPTLRPCPFPIGIRIYCNWWLVLCCPRILWWWEQCRVCCRCPRNANHHRGWLHMMSTMMSRWRWTLRDGRWCYLRQFQWSLIWECNVPFICSCQYQIPKVHKQTLWWSSTLFRNGMVDWTNATVMRFWLC